LAPPDLRVSLRKGDGQNILSKLGEGSSSKNRCKKLQPVTPEEPKPENQRERQRRGFRVGEKKGQRNGNIEKSWKKLNIDGTETYRGFGGGQGHSAELQARGGGGAQGGLFISPTPVVAPSKGQKGGGRGLVGKFEK